MPGNGAWQGVWVWRFLVARALLGWAERITTLLAPSLPWRISLGASLQLYLSFLLNIICFLFLLILQDPDITHRHSYFLRSLALIYKSSISHILKAPLAP